jgi:GTP-binding protein
MNPLFETIINRVPQPKVLENEQNLKILITSLEYDRHFGRILTGKIMSGKISVGDKLHSLTREHQFIEEGKIGKLMSRSGANKIFVDSAFAGDIISVSGFVKTGVTDTVADKSIKTALDTRALDPPIISIQFMVNDSPLAGF